MQVVNGTILMSHYICVFTIFPHRRPAGIIFHFFFQKVTVHKCAGIIWGRAFYEEIQIRYINILMKVLHGHFTITWYFIFRTCLFNLQKKVRCCADIKYGYRKLFSICPLLIFICLPNFWVEKELFIVHSRSNISWVMWNGTVFFINK